MFDFFCTDLIDCVVCPAWLTATVDLSLWKRRLILTIPALAGLAGFALRHPTRNNVVLGQYYFSQGLPHRENIQ